MSSIKDVAKEANVSISTVSIVINGKARERKISEETQDKVLKAMEKLNYQPNLSAKRLRASDSRKTIALFWTTDFRGIMLSRFLTGLQNEITKSQYNYDIIIYPYKNDQLNKEDTLTKISNFHGAIIANASNKDIDFLKKFKPMVPIVLYNREVEDYSSVSVDDIIIANSIFNVIKDKGTIALIEAPYAFKKMELRDQSIKDLLNKNNQQYIEYQVNDNSVQGGYEIASQIDYNHINMIYCASDMIGAGIIHYCYQYNIHIPDNIEIIAIGNGLTNIDAYLNPSLSIVEIPLEKMAEECIRIMSQLFIKNTRINKTINPQIIINKSIK